MSRDERGPVRDQQMIFSAPMVRALLAGTKTQTRRLAWRRDKSGDETGTEWHDLYMDWAFRPIAGFFDYLAGRDGQIYSLKGGTEPRPMKGSPTSKGYLTVSLCGPEGIKTKSVHRLIAEAWFGPPPWPNAEVRHLNANRSHNRIENLDWGTAAENWSDRRSHGHGVHEDHHAAKITMKAADAIRSSTLSQRKLATEYGVSQSLIWDIKHGRVWSPAPPMSERNMALPTPPRLWVREGFAGARPGVANVIYRAEHEEDRSRGPRVDLTWRSPIHMPRWASRLTLLVSEVRVQRLQDISEEDAVAEGAMCRLNCSGFRNAYQGWSMDWSQVGTPRRWARDGKTLTESDVSLGSAVSAFANFINGLHDPKWNHKGDGIFAANPFVVALTFSVVRANIDAIQPESRS